MAQTKVKLISDGVIDVNHLVSGHGITTDNIGEGSNLYYTDARVSTYLSTNSYATEGYVTTAVSDLVAAAPSTLDTLNELAAALGDDPNFATTVTNSIATKLPLAGGTLTGNLGIGGSPSQKLDVRGNIKIDGVNNGNVANFIMTRTDASWRIANETDFRIYSGGGNTDAAGNLRMQINSAGNTSFTGSVSSNSDVRSQRLVLRSDALERWEGTGDDKAVTINYFGYNTTFDYYRDLNIYNGKGGFIATFDGSSSNVGIGTTSPSNNLQAEGDLNADNSAVWFGGGYVNNSLYHYADAPVGISGRWGASGDNGAGITLQARNGASTNWYHGYISLKRDGNFYIGMNGLGTAQASDQVVLQRDGNVGIGTTSPSAKLNTNLSVEGSILAYLAGTAYTFDGDANIAVTHSSSTMGTGTAAGLLLANNNNSNNAISPVISFSARSASNGYNHTYAAIYGQKRASGADSNWNRGDLIFATANSTGPQERIRILDGGNVGIGDSNPGNKLEVNGTTRTHNIVLSNSSNSSNTMVETYRDQHKRTFVSDISFTYTGQGWYYFNLAFPQSGGYGYDLKLFTGRSGNWRNFGYIKHQGYLYWEPDGDFQHVADGGFDIASSYAGGISANVNSYYGANNITDTSAGSLNYSYYIVRYRVYFPDNTTGSNGYLKVHLNTYGYNGTSVYFLKA